MRAWRSGAPVASSKPTLPVGPHASPRLVEQRADGCAAPASQAGRGRPRDVGEVLRSHDIDDVVGGDDHARSAGIGRAPRTPTAISPSAGRGAPDHHPRSRRAARARAQAGASAGSAAGPATAAAGRAGAAAARSGWPDSTAGQAVSRTAREACRVVTAASESSRLDRSSGPLRARSDGVVDRGADRLDVVLAWGRRRCRPSAGRRRSRAWPSPRRRSSWA